MVSQSILLQCNTCVANISVSNFCQVGPAAWARVIKRAERWPLVFVGDGRRGWVAERRGGGGATRRAFTRGPTRRSATGASVAVAATSSMPMWETRGKAEMLSQSYCKSPPTSPPCPGQRERVPPKGRCAAARPPIRGSSSHHTFSNSRNCIRFIWNGVGNFLRSVRGIIHFLSNSTQTVLIFLLRLFGEKGFDWC